MTYKEYLLSGFSDITCCFGGCNSFYWSMSAYDLLMFTLGSFVIISILLSYYNRIPKSNPSKDQLDNHIFQTKDILLQSNSNDANLIVTKSTSSIFVKILVFILIITVFTTPLFKLLKTGYFL